MTLPRTFVKKMQIHKSGKLCLIFPQRPGIFVLTRMCVSEASEQDNSNDGDDDETAGWQIMLFFVASLSAQQLVRSLRPDSQCSSAKVNVESGTTAGDDDAQLLGSGSFRA